MLHSCNVEQLLVNRMNGPGGEDGRKKLLPFLASEISRCCLFGSENQSIFYISSLRIFTWENCLCSRLMGQAAGNGAKADRRSQKRQQGLRAVKGRVLALMESGLTREVRVDAIFGQLHCRDVP